MFVFNQSIRIFNKAYPIVSEIDQKNKSNTLYLYARKINGIQYVKFGEAVSQTVWKRYNGTGETQHNEMIKVWSSSIGDKEIHRHLRKAFTHAGRKEDNPLNTEEAYIVHSSNELDKMIKFISDYVKNKKVGVDHYRSYAPKEPREYQKKIINGAMNILKEKNECLLNISTRAGKSFIGLTLAKSLGASNVLILTPFPKAETSFREEAEESWGFAGYRYTKLTSSVKAGDISEDEKNIIFCSFQYADDTKPNFKALSKIHFDVILIDECHNTSDSDRAKKIINSLKFTKKVYMSGTPYNDLMNGYFDKDDVITFDFIDFIKYAKNHPNEIKLPELYVHNVFNMADLNQKLVEKYPTVFEIADAFQYDTIFSDIEHAKRFFSYLLERDDFIISKKHWFNLDDQKRILVFVNSNKQADIVCESLKLCSQDSNSSIYGYKIHQTSGVEGDMLSTDEKEVNDFYENNEKSIIVSCQTLTTGVTLPLLDTVWFFRNCKSTEQFVQILFRTMTAREGKDKAQMFCFDSEISLTVLKDYAGLRIENLSKEEKNENITYQQSLNDILSCINFTMLSDKMTFDSTSPDYWLEKIHTLPLKYDPTTVFDFNSANRLNILDIFCKSVKSVEKVVASGLGGNVERNKNNIELESLLKEVKENKGNEAELKKITNKIIGQLKYALRNIDRTIWLNTDIESYVDLKKYTPKELVNYHELYEAIIDDSSQRVNQLIEDIRYKESKENLNKELWQNISLANDTDMRTPKELIEKMFSKFSEKPKYLFVPCCGIGSMLVYARDVLNIPQENIYGIELDENNVKICKKIGFTNIYHGDAMNEELLNKIQEDFKKKEVNIKLMKIIMNPPYTTKVEKGRVRKDLDFPIYKNICEHFNEVVCLMRRSQKCKKDGMYTEYYEKDENGNEIKFPGVDVEVSIFVHKKGNKEITIKSKYEENGKLEWIRNNDKTKETDKTLWHLIDKDYKKFKYGDKVPKNYVALNEVSRKNFTIFLEDEFTLKKDGTPIRMLIYIKTSDSKAMKEWLINNVNPLHREFVKNFSDIHINGGFTRTIVVPDNLLPDNYKVSTWKNIKNK